MTYVACLRFNQIHDSAWFMRCNKKLSDRSKVARLHHTIGMNATPVSVKGSFRVIPYTNCRVKFGGCSTAHWSGQLLDNCHPYPVEQNGNNCRQTIWHAIHYVVYRQPAIAAILFYWIRMTVVQQICLAWAVPMVRPIRPVSCSTRSRCSQ